MVTALLFTLVGCGSAANNNSLFGTSGGSPLSSGGGASETFGGSSNPNAGASSGGTASGGTANAGSTSGGFGQGGDGSASSMGGASGGNASSGSSSAGTSSAGSESGGMASGGSAGLSFGGSSNGGGGSGNVLTDCTAFGPDAAFDAETKHCYLAVHALATFTEARAHCTSLGAHLVTLSDQAENDFVWNLDTNEHWIGATDGKDPKESSPGTYTWVDGEPFSYTNWTPGQPNATATPCSSNGDGGTCYEHCGFQWSGGAPGQWNDRLCTHTIEAVCEWDG